MCGYQKIRIGVCTLDHIMPNLLPVPLFAKSWSPFRAPEKDRAVRRYPKGGDAQRLRSAGAKSPVAARGAATPPRSAELT